jgi:hypothetical protein
MWSEVGDCVIESPDFIKAAEEKISEACENLWIAQSRQKGYTDKRRQELKFNVRDHVYLKVSPIHGIRRFRVSGKIALRSIVVPLLQGELIGSVVCEPPKLRYKRAPVAIHHPSPNTQAQLASDHRGFPVFLTVVTTVRHHRSPCSSPHFQINSQVSIYTPHRMFLCS